MSDGFPPEEADGTGADLLKISGRVKWFDAVKGYGFISIENDDSVASEKPRKKKNVTLKGGIGGQSEGARFGLKW
ncbi:MAG: hypothetical protein CMJ66_10135 [Planctomycetaceae bacterium]|nr:hypothetical protein [Planctomycetaceae bacterium]